MIFRIFALTFLTGLAQAQNNHEALDTETSSSRTRQQTEKTPLTALPSTNASAPNSRSKLGSAELSIQQAEKPWQDLEKSERQMASKLLLFWSLSNREEISDQVLNDSGMNREQLTQLQGGLKSDVLPSTKERMRLREPFTDDQLSNRIKSRKKILRLVDKLQSDTDTFKNYLPEMLTVWGEARGIKGFLEDDDLSQEAKMASVIHVLRNRTQKRIEKLRSDGKSIKEYEEKWKVATSRFQFSAFEPYDPNLSQLSFGPRKAGKVWRLESLPKNDRRALLNLARVLSKLDAGLINIPEPLGLKVTRHYLTPVLIPYSKRNEKKLQNQWSKNRRYQVLKIPSQIPEYLAIVPKWALQKNLISHPPVMIKSLDGRENSEVKIPPRDFVYFWGIL